MTDIATAITQSLSRDGQTTPTANIPMGGFKLTGLANATLIDDAIRYDQALVIGTQIQPVTASVAANALTATLNVTSLTFRSATLGSGTVNARNIAAAITVVVPSGATLGTVNAVQSRVVVLAIDNAGTVELAVVNIAGGNNLDETTLITTTAITAGATAANVIYSTTARTNVPFRVVGYIESTQATAGTWATAPSTIQGAGGNALAAMSSLGCSQKWQDMSGSRASGVTYTNTTGKPISVSAFGTSAINAILSILGAVAALNINYSYLPPLASVSTVASCTFIVPPGATYSITWSASSFVWNELR